MKEDFEEELREISPFLANLKKEAPFKTPKFYFDRLTDSVLEKAQSEVPKIVPPQYKTEKTVFSRVSDWVSVFIQPRWAMAMATVAVIAVSSFFYIKKQNTLAPQQLSEISTEDIHEYIKDNIDDFEDDMLLETVVLASDTEGGSILKDMDDKDIEQYLKDNIEEKDLDNIH
jgi:nitrogen regulatory protein PII-like uncharacterized protein